MAQAQARDATGRRDSLVSIQTLASHACSNDIMWPNNYKVGMSLPCEVCDVRCIAHLCKDPPYIMGSIYPRIADLTPKDRSPRIAKYHPSPPPNKKTTTDQTLSEKCLTSFAMEPGDNRHDISSPLLFCPHFPFATLCTYLTGWSDGWTACPLLASTRNPAHPRLLYVFLPTTDSFHDLSVIIIL